MGYRFEQADTSEARPSRGQDAVFMSSNLTQTLSKFQSMIKEVERRFAEREQQMQNRGLPSHLQADSIEDDRADSYDQSARGYDSRRVSAYYPGRQFNDCGSRQDSEGSRDRYRPQPIMDCREYRQESRNFDAGRDYRASISAIYEREPTRNVKQDSAQEVLTMIQSSLGQD